VEKAIGTRDGRWFTVRIMPYRTQDDRIDGVVITFANITGSKTLEDKLRKSQSVLEQHVSRQSIELKRRTRKTKL
jgi:two-component system CheB/CheR fusion protein